MFVFKGLEYLWMLFFIMITAGIAKDKELFAPAFAYILDTFKSNRVIVALVSAVSGVLPIEGRVTVSAGVLDTICSKDNKSRHKMGIIDYLSTHHYYLWSPLEKTVILPIAAFGLSYTVWLGMIWPLLVATVGYVTYYFITHIKESDIVIESNTPFKISEVLRNVIPFFVAIGYYIYQGGEGNVFYIFGALAAYYCLITQTWDLKKLLSYINWQVIATVAVAIMLGNYFKSIEPVFKGWVQGGLFDVTTITGLLAVSSIGFIASFLMGSSGKYVAFAVLLAQLFGVEYFIWFFTIDYIGYLLSPTHKCVAVGNRYFGTPIKDYYIALGMWCVVLIITAGIITIL